MYLSRVEIDTKNRRKISDLSHLGAYHNWVEQSYPEEQSKEKRSRKLWRIDTLNNKEYLLVLSEKKPDLEKLEHYGVTGSAMTKNYDPLLDNLKQGEVLRFRLTANPTHKVSVPGQKQGRIMPHITVDQQKKWFLGKAQANGFEVIDNIGGTKNFDITSREWLQLFHKKTGKVRMSRVTYEGILKITDLEKFKVALTKGIGREKAYGMGLLTVIPR